jgi:HEAT repeat protein
MRIASVVACSLLGVCIALAPAQEKTPDKPPADPPTEKMPPVKATLSATEQVEGKTLAEWLQDLTHEDPSIREKALCVIPIYGASAASHVPTIVSHAKNDPDLGPKVRAIIALGVMEISKEDVRKVVDVLSEVLSKRDEQLAAKLQAALALSRFDAEEGKPAISALIAGVNDNGSWQIRKASILALRRIGSNKTNGPDKFATFALKTLALRDPAFHVRIEAIQALGYMDKPHDLQRYKDLLSALDSLTKVNERSSANDQILAMWSQVSYMALDKVTEERIGHIARNLTSKHLSVRGEAVLCIGTLGMKAKTCVPDLTKRIADNKEDLGIVITSCWALVSIGDKDPKALDAMEERAKSKDTPAPARDQMMAAVEALKNSKKAEFTEKKDTKPDDKPKDRRQAPR